jgi:hypothetical protein
MITMAGIKHELETMKKGRSAWARGVYNYAWELIDNVEQNYNYIGMKEHDQISMKELECYMLNGASDWKSYSWGGSSLIYDSDIAQALCTPSELKKTDNGRRRPNKNEEWLDVQARALTQAAHLIKSIAWSLDRKGAQA